MSIIYRIATDKDIDQLVELFSSDGNPHNWSHKKFHHYYSEYPEGIPISVVADDSGKIVGHFGIFPGQVGSFTVMTSHAAYVNVKYRNTKVIAGILKKIDQICIDLKKDFIWAPANLRFTPVLAAYFNWKTIGYVSFVNVKQYEIEKYTNRYQFSYSDKWYQWKFGEKRDIYLQDYKKDNTTYHQLLKTANTNTVIARDHGLPHLNCWVPTEYSKEKSNGWIQPISIKIINSDIPKDVLDINNWFLEMGDSDAFEWRKIPYLCQE